MASSTLANPPQSDRPFDRLIDELTEIVKRAEKPKPPQPAPKPDPLTSWVHQAGN